MLGCVRSFVTPWTVAPQTLSTGFSRQESWSGWPFPSPGDLPNSGIKAGSPALQVNSSPTEPAGKPNQDVKERHGGSTEPRSPKVGPPVCSPPWPPCLSRAGCPSRRTRILGWPGGVCLTSAPCTPATMTSLLAQGSLSGMVLSPLRGPPFLSLRL